MRRLTPNESIPAEITAAHVSVGRTYRVESLDVLRGILMVIMALDHARDYFSSVAFDPTDPTQSWPALFLTRWVTHICAPGFILLAGTSVYLQRQRKSASMLTRALLLRGLWLIFLEVTVVSFGWSFSIGMPILQVIWVIGISMIALAGLQWLPLPVVSIFACGVIFGHNLLDSVHAKALGSWSDAWHILHERGLLTYHAHPFALYGYPVLPWVGVLAVGYSLGPVVTQSPRRRQRMAALAGVCSLVTFAVLRLTHSYGDPGAGFRHLATLSKTIMSFFSVQKYPPSLHYLLATLGIVFLLFALCDGAVERRWIPRLRAFFNVYGRVPFFFYVLHIFLTHGLALLAARATNPNWRFWITPDVVFTSHFAGWGYSLPIVYFVYVCVVGSLYPLCRWFSRLKDRRRDWWLAYL